MKAYRKRHHYSRKKTSPSKLSWICLFAAWMIVLPAVFFVGKAALAEIYVQDETVPVFASDQISDAPTSGIRSLFASCTKYAPVQALRSDKPTILIYHTHTTEAYYQTEQDQYVESSKWRTNDHEKNVVAVGETLKGILETEYGFCVLHDATDHEPPKLADAYERSLVTIQEYRSQYPSIVLFIDLHRDAYETDKAPTDYVTVDNVECARLMLVVGKGEKYADKTYYSANSALAERITEHLKSIHPDLVRPVRVKSGRYNQHVAPNSILVEVGHNANTLEQAKNAMPFLAESIAYAFRAGSIELNDWIPN